MSGNLELLLYAIPALVIAISLHEMMHSVMGYWLGDTTAMEHGRISLNPLRHIDPITTVALPLVLVLLGLPPFAAAKPVPINMFRLKYEEFGMALVGLAGPLTNLLIAILAGIALRFTGLDGTIGTFLLINVSINVGLFVFNLIPFPPLDGSRVLYALAPEGVQKVMMQIERMGFGAIFFFMFVIFPFIGPAIIRVQQTILNVLL
ncbi:site-2 protease family protein [Candidatus Saccharibacteria bacterium]|nr:site-2 protease family protein [Candidatus Saccharibacteria bacterium]